ncbi:Ubiquitin--protein ligase [Bertholletia excelsa]
MMDDGTRDETFIDLELDLNQEPLDNPSTSSVPELGPLLNQLETTHDQIEERIRQLEAVTARARERIRLRRAQNAPEASNVLTQMLDDSGGEGALQEITADRTKNCKGDNFHLVARALQLDSEVEKVVEEGEFFDCNVCLGMAREPILTCCGHLFCWICFYHLPYLYATAKECPVCKGEVTETNIIPIYGNGKDKHVEDLEKFGFKIPPRPKAQRIDSVRQQRFGLGVSHIPVAEALRRIRAGLGSTGTNLQQVDGDHANVTPNNNSTEAAGPPVEAAPNNVSGRLRSRQFSRLLSETAASLSTISTALNSPRLFRDIELIVDEGFVGRSLEDPRSTNATVVEPSNQTSDSTAHANPEVSHASSSGGQNVSASHEQVDNIRPDAPALPSRRRNRLSRASNTGNEVRRACRRRRLS